VEILSKTEELILLSVWNLGNEAYGVTIRNYLIKTTGKKFSIGGIYVPLDRLVRKGLLTTYQGEPTPERGGMSKRYYRMTKKGITILNESKKVYETMWSGIDTHETSKVSQ
jgi:DNA-binding PadR family transcriptional regulator